MNNDNQTSISRCGLIAIVGRPNVGKSTLLNHLMGQKLSITSRKPQTTRDRILGIKTVEESQFIFVDTPGIHKGQERAINKHMNRTALASLDMVDCIVFLVDSTKWTEEDALVAERVTQIDVPVCLVINKVDKVDDKEDLLPLIESFKSKVTCDHIVPVSALRGHNLDALEQTLEPYLPEGPHFYPEDQITDKSQRFLAAELIREKVTRQLGEEIPYSVAVEIEEFKEEKGVTHISGLLLVEKDGQKPIIIGKQGERLKRIGSEARKDMERAFFGKVMLSLWVKVKRGWSDDERALQSLGYIDQ